MLKELIPEKILQEIDHWMSKYPANQKQSAVLSALMLVQEHNGGWLTDELIKAVADYLGMPHIAAFEVATFYTMFELQPIGKNRCLRKNLL